MEAIIVGVAAIIALYVAFKVTKWVVSGCLKLVVLAVLAAVVGALGWYLYSGHRF